MSLVGFDDLYRFADSLAAPISVVAAGGADPTVLQALSIAQRNGWVEPVLTGCSDEIRQLAADLRIDLAGFRIVDADDPAGAGGQGQGRPRPDLDERADCHSRR